MDSKLPRDRLRTVARVLIVGAVGLLAATAVWAVTVAQPAAGATPGEILTAIVVVGAGLWIGNRIASTVIPGYQVAAVSVTGPITRTETGLPTGPVMADAEAIVDAIERADADRGAKGLLLHLNTPGGEVVPSDDVRRAVEDFDGPTVAYATDTCASGGYWIASGCDEIWARDTSLVGSIGVLASRLDATDLADRIGVGYERFAAGEFKDAGMPLSSFDEADREYLQGLTDDIFERFLERVTAGRDLDAEAVRETEARVYVGSEAKERGLVDGIGDRDDAEAAIADRLDRPAVAVREFGPTPSLPTRLRRGLHGMAHGVGSGIAAGLDSSEVEFRV